MMMTCTPAPEHTLYPCTEMLVKGEGATATIPRAAGHTTATSPVRRNTFTVSYANRAAAAASCVDDNTAEADDVTAAVLLPFREDLDMHEQLAALRRHKTSMHEAFVATHEAQVYVSAADKMISIYALVHLAAQRDVQIAKASGCPEAVSDFMGSTWHTFMQQAQQFLNGATEESAPLSQHERCRVAMENISSIGIWFAGPSVSLPLRRYAVQVVAPDGSLQSVVVAGLLSFTYSSYIMQMRQSAQQMALSILHQMGEQLGTPCLFIPALLIAPQVSIS